jgi:hypothetical protein
MISPMRPERLFEGNHRASLRKMGKETLRAQRNYEMKNLTFEEESTVVESDVGRTDEDREPYSGDGAARKRNRLSFYLNRRSAGAVAYWQKKQQRDQQEAQLQAEAMRDIEPTAQNYRSAAQQALVAAMDVNNETLQSIQHMEHVMNETEAVGAESAVILRRGQENLEVVDTTLVNMEPTLKRAKKDLIQFFRRMMRDKICVCLVFVVLALVIAVLITSKLKGSPSLPLNIQVPGNFTGL